MLDLAILTTIDLPAVPSPLVAAEERVLLSARAELAKRTGEEIVQKFRSQAADVDRQLKDILAVGIEEPPSDDLVAILSEAIAAWDKLIDNRSKQHERLLKFGDRVARQLFQRDPSHGAVVRTINGKVSAIDRCLIDKIIDFTMHLRAMRSALLQSKPTAEVVQFDNPADMAKYLKSRIAG